MLVLHPPNRRSFDLDGASSALKGAVDGVFDAVGRDDSDIAELRVRRGCVVPGGAVDLLFTAHEPGLLD